MIAYDAARIMAALCVIVLTLGIGALAVGLTLYRWQRAVDVGVEADQKMLDRLSHKKALISDSGADKSLERYVNDSLAYHQSLQALYRHIIKMFFLGGAGLGITGGLQLYVLRRLRRQLANVELLPITRAAGD